MRTNLGVPPDKVTRQIATPRPNRGGPKSVGQSAPFSNSPAPAKNQDAPTPAMTKPPMHKPFVLRRLGASLLALVMGHSLLLFRPLGQALRCKKGPSPRIARPLPSNPLSRPISVVPNETGVEP